MAGDGTTTYVSFQSDSLPYSCSPPMALRSDKSTLGSETGRYDSHHHHLTYHTLIVRTDGLLSTCQHHYPQTTTLEDVGVVRRHAMFGLAQCTGPSIAGEVKSKSSKGAWDDRCFIDLKHNVYCKGSVPDPQAAMTGSIQHEPPFAIHG